MADNLSLPAEETLSSGVANPDSSGNPVLDYLNQNAPDPMAGAEAQKYLQDNPPSALPGAQTLPPSPANPYIEQILSISKKEASDERAAGEAEALAADPLKAELQSRPSYDKEVTNKDLPQPKLPSPVDPKEFQQFSGMALLISALAGSRTAAPLTSALNGFAAGINGYYKGSQDAYKKNMEIYGKKVDEWNANHQELVNRYNASLNDKNMSVEEKKLNIQLTAAEWGHKLMADQIESGGIMEAAKLTNEMDKMRYQMLALTGRWTQQGFRNGESLRKEYTNQAKPLDEYDSKLKKIMSYVNDPSGASMVQIQAELAAIPDRSRLTNMFFEATSSMGPLWQRVSNHISRFIQGDYSAASRDDIRKFVDFTENNYIKPQRDILMRNYQNAAVMNNIDPKQIFDPTVSGGGVSGITGSKTIGNKTYVNFGTEEQPNWMEKASNQ